MEKAYAKQSIDSAGSNSTRHTILGWLSLLPPLFIWIWTLLNIVQINYGVTRSWDGILLSSSLAFIGIALCVVRWWQQKDIIKRSKSKGDDDYKYTVKRAAMINDNELFKTMAMAGLCYFCIALTVWIHYQQDDGNRRYGYSFYLDDTTRFMSEGVFTLIAVKVTHLAGFLLSFWVVATAFLSSQGSDIDDALLAKGVSKNPANYSSAAPMNAWAKKAAANAAAAKGVANV
jgi:hypothetical protein